MICQAPRRAVLCCQAILQSLCCTVHQVTPTSGQRMIVAFKDDLRIVGCFEFKGVVQTDCLNDSVKVVISIGAFTQDAQTEIDFGKSWKTER